MFFQGDRHLDFSGQVRIIKLVPVAAAFLGCELEMGPTEGVPIAGVKFVSDIL